jgi:putative ABC transport system permease protein
VLGIPLGIAIFLGVYALANDGSTDEAATPPAWQLALLVPAVVLLVALVCGLPARLAARIRVVDALRYE